MSWHAGLYRQCTMPASTWKAKRQIEVGAGELREGCHSALVRDVQHWIRLPLIASWTGKGLLQAADSSFGYGEIMS